MNYSCLIYVLLVLVYQFKVSLSQFGRPYSLINRVQTECETIALSIGTLLSDFYNSFDEATEWDMRIHHDFLVEHLGFAGWIQAGLWHSGGKTPHGNHAPSLHKKGGWTGNKHIPNSSYWAIEDKWIYMMGDSTKRQIWATTISPLSGNEFERNAKEWTRENCARQFPHRRNHPSGGYFPIEGWYGKCGNNEVTCHLSGFGKFGKISFDWKHFPWEDYDEWLFGNEGPWGNDTSTIRPHFLTFQLGVHTCFHAYNPDRQTMNQSMITKHENDLSIFMAAVRKAVDRENDLNRRTIPILVNGGRVGNPDPQLDRCSWHFNRIAAREAHVQGFAVLEREEIERRLMFKSEHNPQYRTMKFMLHLENPAPQIIATSLLGLITCLTRNSSTANAISISSNVFDVFKRPLN